jgi:hypothetical protein
VSGPDWDIDRGWGEDGEEIVRGLSRYTVEVKRKRRPDELLYIELQQDPGRRGEYRPSGFAVTKADYAAFVVGDTGCVIFLPASLIGWALARDIGIDASETDGGNPTTGRLMRLGTLLQYASRWRDETGQARP